VISHAEGISSALKSLARDHSYTYHFVAPIWNWIDAIRWPHFDPPEVRPNPNNTATQVGLAIDTMLIDVQEVLKVAGTNEPAENWTSKDRFLTRGLSQVMKCTRSLNLDGMDTHLQQLFVILSGATCNETSNAAGYLLPFLERYLSFVDSQLLNHHHWTNALFKLTYISCSITRKICNDGFCQPLEGEGQEGEGKESADGIGMGEGTGKDNVSEEIKEESQVEGLQDTGKEGNTEREKDGDDKAIEMSEDIDGELEDVEDQDEMEEGEDSGDESAVEDKAEDLDANDPHAVDEKLWGDEQGKEPKDSDVRTEKDRPSEQQQGNPEVVAKENERKHKEEKGGGDQAETAETDIPEDVPEVDEEQPGAQGAPIEDRIDETETLNLPEDLQMGEGEVPKGSEDDDNGESDEGESEEAVMQDPFPEQEDVSMSEEAAQENDEPDTSQAGQPGEKDVEDRDSNQKPDLVNPDIHGGADKDYDGMAEPSADTNREDGQTGEGGKHSGGGQAGEDEEEQMVRDA
jgi:midasin